LGVETAKERSEEVDGDVELFTSPLGDEIAGRR
jgi:hypothetical protein